MKYLSRQVSSALRSTAAILFLSACTAVGAATNDRDYQFGDDADEDAANSPGDVLGDGPSNVNSGFTLDSTGPSGAFVDIEVFGTPTYVDVSDRPGASPGDLGAQFDGVDDYLATARSLNAPTQSWNDVDLYPAGFTTAYPDAGHARNYNSLFGRAAQFWAKPVLDGAQQDLVVDTEQNAVTITADDTWGLVFGGVGVDSEVAVDTSGDGWSHVMQIGGTADLVGGGSAFGGVLLVDGIAVAARNAFFNPSTTPLSIGANQAGVANHYEGVIDDLRLMVWGDNSDDLGADDAVGGNGINADGDDYGTLDLNVDNDWIAQEIADLESMGGITIDDGDVNLDGTVDDTDIGVFVTNWLSTQTLNGLQVGDWNSRQLGDLNYDGAVDLSDWQILRRDHVNGPGLSLAAALAGEYSVPEPASFATILIGCGVLLGCFRRST